MSISQIKALEVEAQALQVKRTRSIPASAIEDKVMALMGFLKVATTLVDLLFIEFMLHL